MIKETLTSNARKTMHAITPINCYMSYTFPCVCRCYKAKNMGRFGIYICSTSACIHTWHKKYQSETENGGQLGESFFSSRVFQVHRVNAYFPKNEDMYITIYNNFFHFNKGRVLYVDLTNAPDVCQYNLWLWFIMVKSRPQRAWRNHICKAGGWVMYRLDNC